MVYDREHQYYSLPDYRFYSNQVPENLYHYDYPPICPCQYQMVQQHATNPYPFEQVNEINRRNPNAEQHIMQQFLNEDGQVDVQKMLKTIGQFADTVQQVSPVIKQINDLIRSFRT